MALSVEIEPPKGVFRRTDEDESEIYSEVLDYLDHVDMISITNRPVFGLSPLTLASQIKKIVDVRSERNIRVNLHLTTRLTHYDTFKSVLDAHRIGLSDLLPILGDPRGPKDLNYFKNGFDILGFVSFLNSGEEDYLYGKYQEMYEKDQFTPISDASFNVGTVVDVNPTKKVPTGKTIDIRERQIKFARKKEKLGAEYLISQGFFDVDCYFDFIDEADLGIPIYAGILPARLRLIDMFGLPMDTLSRQKLRSQMTTSDEKKVGNKISAGIYRDLEERGCDHIQIFSIGNSTNFSEITGIDIQTEWLKDDKLKKELKKTNLY